MYVVFYLTTASTSKLRDYYGFKPPRLSSAQEIPNPPNPIPKRRKKKPSRSPSSLDRPASRPVRSNLPFDFRFSYTDVSPSARPIGLREPKYSPFGPDRPWIGICAPVVDPRVTSVDGIGDEGLDLEEKRREMRERIQGESLTGAERKILVEMSQRGKTKAQINLGRDGLTHNLLNDVHNHWKHAETVRIKCLGVPTVDMRNVCSQLEDKTFGNIIHRHSGSLVLYRGRNYNPKKKAFYSIDDVET